MTIKTNRSVPTQSIGQASVSPKKPQSSEAPVTRGWAAGGKNDAFAKGGALLRSSNESDRARLNQEYQNMSVADQAKFRQGMDAAENPSPAALRKIHDLGARSARLRVGVTDVAQRQSMGNAARKADGFANMSVAEQEAYREGEKSVR